MSLDITNSDLMDCSPFAEQYSGVTRTATTAVVPRTTGLTAVNVGVPKSKGIISAQPTKPVISIKTVPPRAIVHPTPTPSPTPTPTPSPTPTPTPTPSPTPVPETRTPSQNTTPPPASTGGGGGGSSTDESQPEQETDSSQAGARVSKPDEENKFYKSFWFWGLLVGGVGAYFYAKNKNKGMVASVLIGAGIGGGLGYTIEKFMNKPTPTTKTPEKTQENPE
jgi:hypothetical protein